MGSALMMASQQGQAMTGMMMLLAYSIGLGLPFMISALLIYQLKTTFDWIKRDYRAVNIVCGVFLIVIGVLMAMGMMGKFLALLS